MRGDLNTDAWSTMTTTGYEQSEDVTVIIISAVHESTEVASAGSTQAPITSVPSTDTFITALLILYACVTISGLALIGATMSELHVALPANKPLLEYLLQIQLVYYFIHLIKAKLCKETSALARRLSTICNIPWDVALKTL